MAVSPRDSNGRSAALPFRETISCGSKGTAGAVLGRWTVRLSITIRSLKSPARRSSMKKTSKSRILSLFNNNAVALGCCKYCPPHCPKSMQWVHEEWDGSVESKVSFSSVPRLFLSQ